MRAEAAFLAFGRSKALDFFDWNHGGEGVSIKVHSYFNVSEKSGELARIYRESGDKAIYLVPARLDRDAVLELICGGDPSFGARPAIWTAGDLLSELQLAVGSRERIIDPPDHKLILRWLTAEFLAEAEECGGALAPGFYHSGFVSVLGENIKDLLAEDVSAEALRSALGDDAEGDAPEAALTELYERYMDYLGAHGLADAGQIFSLAREKLTTKAGRQFIEGRRIVFVGFLSFTSSQLKLVKALGESADVEMFQPETGLDMFHDGIMQLGEEYTQRAEWNVPVVKIEGGNPHLELEAVSRELALWACGEGALSALGRFGGYGDIGLTVGTERLRTMEYALSRYKIPYNVQEGGSASDTLIGSLPSLIWRARRSGWNNYETSALLSCPLLFGWDGRPLQYDGGLQPDCLNAWLEALPREAGETMRRAEALCARFCEGVSPVDALALWLDFLRESRVQERAASAASEMWALDGRVKETASAMDELEKKIKKLSDDSKNIGPASGVVLKGAEAVSFINDWSSSATLPVQLPQSRSLTVYVGAPPTLALHRFWIMTGVDSNRWPGVLRESMLLRGAAKAKFNAAAADIGEASHLPELHEEREQKEAVFRRILATGWEGAVVTRAAYNENGEECGESRFAARALAAAAPRSWRLEHAEVYAAERSMPDGGGPWFPQAEVLCMQTSRGTAAETPDGRAAPSKLPKIRISDIDRWNVCPYMYWCERILGVESARPALYDARKAGTLAHRVWDDAFRSKKKNPDLSILSRVMGGWAVFKGSSYPELDGDARLARYERRLRRQMFSLAAEQDALEGRLASVPKISTETEVRLEDFKFAGALFVGQADRIDRFGDGFVAIDYKLGRSKAHERELQVAAYCAVQRETLGWRPLGFGWIGHAGPSLDGYFSGGYFDIYAFRGTAKKRASIDERIDEALELMEKMALSVRNGEYPPKYDVANRICTNCAYFTLCRKREKKVYIESLIEEAGNDGGE